MNSSFKEKNSQWYWFTGFLVLGILYLQVEGLLPLVSGGSKFLVRILSNTPEGVAYPQDNQIRFLTSIPIALSQYLGISSLKYYAYLYSFCLALCPALPILYYAFKAKKHDNLIFIPILNYAYFATALDLSLAYDQIHGHTLIFFLGGAIYYSRYEQSWFEKILILLVALTSYYGFISFLICSPILIFGIIKNFRKSNAIFLSLLLLILVATIYKHIALILDYRWIWSIFAEYVGRSFQIGYHIVIVPVFTLFLLSAFLKKDVFEKPNYSTLFYAFTFILVLVLAEQNVGRYMFSKYQDGMNDTYLILTYLSFISLYFFGHKIQSPSLPIIPFSLILLLGFYINIYHGLRIKEGFKAITKICKEPGGHVKQVNPYLIKKSYQDEGYFPILSILACGFEHYPVKSMIHVVDSEFFNYVNPSKPETYPNLERYGVKYEMELK